MGLSGLELSFLHFGTKTVISLWPRLLNHSTHSLIPRQENISLLPWLIATLLPSITIGLNPLPSSQIVIGISVFGDRHSANGESHINSLLFPCCAPNFINSAKSSFCAGFGPRRARAAWTRRSV